MGEIEYLKELLFCNSVPERTHELCHTWPDQIHQGLGKSCLEVQRKVQGAAASQGMPHAKKLHLLTSGLELSRFAQCRKVPRTSQAWLLVPAAGTECQGQGWMCPVSCTSQAVIPCFQLPAEAGKDGNEAVASHLNAQGGNRALTLFCPFTPFWAALEILSEVVFPFATIGHLHRAQQEFAPEFAGQNYFKLSWLHSTLMQRAREGGTGDFFL